MKANKINRSKRVVKQYPPKGGSLVADVEIAGGSSAIISPQSIREGLPYKFVTRITPGRLSRKEFIGVTKIPPATLDRRKKTGRLNSDESDKVYRLMTILDAAERLFDGDNDKALNWCKSPARGLGGVPPIELADTTAGQDMVIDYIGRIEHGIAT